MKALLGSGYCCDKCDTPYSNKNNNKCRTLLDVCKLCKKPLHSDETKNKIYCENCN